MIPIQFPNLTPSRVTSLGCRKRFYEEHIAKSVPQGEFSLPLTYGTAVHQALQWLNTPTNPTPPAERDVEAIVRRAFLQQPYPAAEWQQEEMARALPMIQNYHLQTVGIDKVLGTEVFAKFALKTGSSGKLVFGAKFDLLLSRQGGTVLVIRDYKTGLQRGVDLASACIMLAVARTNLLEYKRIYGCPFREVVLEYDYLNQSGLAGRIALGINEVKTLWPELKERAQFVYSSKDFPAEPGDYCPLCPLLETCRPAQQVSLDELDRIFL